jgi:hypothetical protein
VALPLSLLRNAIDIEHSLLVVVVVSNIYVREYEGEGE